MNRESVVRHMTTFKGVDHWRDLWFVVYGFRRLVIDWTKEAIGRNFEIYAFHITWSERRRFIRNQY